MQMLVRDRDHAVIEVDTSIAVATDTDAERPELDEFGLLHYHGRWVALSSTEERTLRPLLDSWRRVVSRRDLVESVWPGAGARTTTLHTALARLRRRVRPLGLGIETIRARGFLIEPQHDNEPSPRTAAATSGAGQEGSSWLTS
jgi:DNA-binding winged helix-turn-helix (wHTH) protein